MEQCWYCYWGWAEPVARIFREAVESLGGDENPLLYGPGHIVWEDENFNRSSVEFCLRQCDEKPAASWDMSADALAAVRASLEALLALPDAAREVQPEGYDGENPQDYPPAVPVVRV
jgi:hypothetical protein